MHGSFRATEVKGPRKKKQLRPLFPNEGLKVDYQKRLEDLIDDMVSSVQAVMIKAYRKNQPAIAQDEGPAPSVMARFFGGQHQHWRGYVNGELLVKANGQPRTFKTEEKATQAALKFQLELETTPAEILTEAFAGLRDRWLKQFDEAAPKLAEYFSTAVHKRTDAALQKILRDGGFSVRFQQTPAMRDIFNATVSQNVSLIKSIPEQYLKDIEGHVMRSVQAGRDLHTLAKHLEDTYSVTKRRAAFIARSQNNLATSAMNKARQEEMNIVQAKWRHSGGGHHPRPTHVANNNRLYDVKKGWFDPHVKQWIWPGQLPNCRCVSIPVIPGFE